MPFQQLAQMLPQIASAAPFLSRPNVTNASSSSSSSNVSFAPVISVQTGGSGGDLSPSASGSASSSGAATAVPDYANPGLAYGSPGPADIYSIDDQGGGDPVSTEIIPGIPDLVLLIGGGVAIWYASGGKF